MRPDELSTALRKIASKIDNSENPSRRLVVEDLKAIVKKASYGFHPNEFTWEIGDSLKSKLKSGKNRIKVTSASGKDYIVSILWDGRDTYAEVAIFLEKDGNLSFGPREFPAYFDQNSNVAEMSFPDIEMILKMICEDR
jgi:hypothetical protein